jgi:outer membrane protein assembly factor BamB
VPTDILQFGSNVYFGSFHDKWSSINLQTGGLNWDFSTGASNQNCDMPKAPVTDKNRLFIAGLDGVLYSLDAASGRVFWKRKLAAAPSTSLALRDRTLYVGTNDQHIYRLDAETGTVMSELAVEAKPVGRPAFADDSLMLFLESASDRAGYIISVDSKLAGVRWKQKSTPDWASERPHIWKGYVLGGNCRGEVAAFRASDGEPQWRLNLKGCVRSIGSSGNTLFVGAQEGTVYAFGLSDKP